LQAESPRPERRDPLSQRRVGFRQAGPAARTFTVTLPSGDLAQQRDHAPSARLPGVEPDIACDEIRARLGQPVEQRNELSKRAGGVAQSVGLEHLEITGGDPLELWC
jgi:hypothetical protein